jgi:ATP-dependent Clp protease adaptor protein ClpS
MKPVTSDWYFQGLINGFQRPISDTGSQKNDSGEDEFVDTTFRSETKSTVKNPRMYKVILHNDDYTTMDFVVDVLINIFKKPAADATRIMLEVHKKGMGICGVYVYDIAVTKVNQVHQLAKQNEFPLRCSYEEI